jgi:CRP/FNR family transcriptional regulator, cyclic AMP receptor protein
MRNPNLVTAEVAMNILALFQNDEDIQEFKSGSVIFKEGDSGDVMYVVISGSVEMKLKGVVVNLISSNEVFGEMALVDGSPRSATAQVLTDCKIVTVKQAKFESLIQKQPDFALYVMQTMAERLRKMTELSIREKIKRVDSKILDALFD